MARTKQFLRGTASRDDNLRQKRAKNQEEDRISNLPECILTNILSRLPTKDAVRTSILSKQWEYKWTSIYNLDFCDRKFYACRETRKERFSYFVNRVLNHGVGSLNRFSLHCSPGYELSTIQNWISTALSRNVQTLEVDIWSPTQVLPACIYNSNSLKELRLLAKVTINVPNETFFSRLKKIDFNHVILRNQKSRTNNGKQLLLKFPFLESLSMYCCKWKNVKAVKLDAPLLTSFNMTHGCKHFGNRMEGFEFEICSPNLADFKLSGELSECYVLPKPSPVEAASITLFPNYDWSPSGFRIARTLKQMNALKHLALSAEVLIALNHAAQIGSLPLFVNLTHLKLYTTFYSRTDDAAVVGLIQRAPVLQMLTMDMSTSLGNGLQYDGITEDGIPACFSSHLKVAKFSYFHDCLKLKDLNLIKFILKNARALEQMQFREINNSRTSIPSPEFQALLLSFPRCSSAAQIVFS